jgi:hypothetical protein
MTYTVIFTATIPAPETNYAGVNAQTKADADVIEEFRKSQPGYISEFLEIIDTDTRKQTIVFDSEASYDAYGISLTALPEFARRTEYYNALGIVWTVQRITTQ